MAGIGMGLGAFADGMSAGYTMGKQLKNGMEEQKTQGADGMGVMPTAGSAPAKSPGAKTDEGSGLWSTLGNILSGKTSPSGAESADGNIKQIV